MTHETNGKQRLQFLVRVIEGACRNLQATDERLFAKPFTAETAKRLDDDQELSERADAFVARFSRLQDTLGDKLLSELLEALGENRAILIDRLDLFLAPLLLYVARYIMCLNTQQQFRQAQAQGHQEAAIG